LFDAVAEGALRRLVLGGTLLDLSDAQVDRRGLGVRVRDALLKAADLLTERRLLAGEGGEFL